MIPAPTRERQQKATQDVIHSTWSQNSVLMARWRTDLWRAADFLHRIPTCSAGGVVVDLPYREDVKIEISSNVGLFGYSMADEVWRGDIYHGMPLAKVISSGSFLLLNNQSQVD